MIYFSFLQALSIRVTDHGFVNGELNVINPHSTISKNTVDGHIIDLNYFCKNIRD